MFQVPNLISLLSQRKQSSDLSDEETNQLLIDDLRSCILDTATELTVTMVKFSYWSMTTCLTSVKSEVQL